ncbi:MAG TPA: putative molybdenum carrier protein, partial [Gaiellaceae bacterium]|nr:putative molybdenum carrier protein [Gaiellaceae bacterium]
MITIVHGGQTGVDRGAHEAAIDNGWRVAGYMPRDGRDELGPIPPDVARFLVAHEKAGYGARTEANVRASG